MKLEEYGHLVVRDFQYDCRHQLGLIVLLDLIDGYYSCHFFYRSYNLKIPQRVIKVRIIIDTYSLTSLVVDCFRSVGSRI